MSTQMQDKGEAVVSGPDEVVVDTTVIVAVLTNEATKTQILEATIDCSLVAPASLDIEIGNAFSRMFKRNRIDFETAERALAAFRRIPILRTEIDLDASLQLAHDLDVYAYDAYVMHCALQRGAPLISLDGGLLEACRRAGVETIEVKA